MTTQEHNLVDYDSAVRDFRLEVPERFNFGRDVVDRWAADPAKLAMLWVGSEGTERRLTFRHFAERSDRFAHLLRRLGLQPGDRVMVQLPRLPEWWEVLLGCFKAGAVAVPGTVLLTPKDVQYRTGLAEGVAYVTDADGARKVDQVRHECPSATPPLTTSTRSARSSASWRSTSGWPTTWCSTVTRWAGTCSAPHRPPRC